MTRLLALIAMFLFTACDVDAIFGEQASPSAQTAPAPSPPLFPPPYVPLPQVPSAPMAPPPAVIRPRNGVATDAIPFGDVEHRNEIHATLARIASNGPYPYRQDGVVFENRERRLPAHDDGYYHEFTVRTPGTPTRGARRIIRGDSSETYYTDDHYRSFVLIDPSRY